MIDILNARFDAKTTAEAAGIKPATMQTWLHRYGTEKSRDDVVGGGTQGVARTFSFHSVMHFAIAGKLIEAGFQTESAYNAGALFAHSALLEVAGIRRMPAMPFDDQNGKVKTILCVSKNGSVQVPYGEGIDTLREANILLGHPEVMTTMPINNLWIDVCLKLGYQPWAVLQSVYKAI